ncbi:hypothetical protein DFH07DRAFT_1054735 [Mycena maculata]|uniref:Ino eighty subunit 1 n=1 Tax=Mycena maculata TaxID=230809 RepID=A0AAD7KE42_9AGAR|nr:hypothetical protein DFH07DRAFT_1054735 [Mycena maculata]
MARKTRIALYHADGEPLTRADIQFDFLNAIFADETKAFSDPGSRSTKLCFRDLYVNAILRSPKAKSVLKEKLELSTGYSRDFAMLALLTNVGRISTTMSFFAEMRTAQRTYHPIPSLQRTNGNLLDAPRIKSILKTSVLEGETKNGLATPAQVLARAKAGQIPPTTLPNLIFVFANHSVQIGRDHLSEMEFLDLFLPNDASSESRARAFLWLCYHYHEGPCADQEDLDDYDGDVASQNPFSDPSRPGKVPSLVTLTPSEAAVENLDPEDEKALAIRLIAQREAIVQDHLLKESAKESKATARTSSPRGTPSPTKPRGKGGANAKAGPSSVLKRKAEAVKEEEPDETPLKKLKRVDLHDKDTLVHDVNSSPLRPMYRQAWHSSSHESDSPPPPRLFPVHAHRYSSYKRSHPRTMLQHAWHVAATSDPLADSDEEPDDEYLQSDHARRLAVLARVRGKPPTPEPEGLRAIPLQLGAWHDDLFF